MNSFFALIWDETDETAHKSALGLLDLAKTNSQQAPTLTMPGCILTDLGGERDNRNILAVQPRDGPLSGVIYGQIYENPVAGDPPTRIIRLDSDASALITASSGDEMIRRYWGNYIAILKTGSRWHVITDPTSSIPCFHMDHAGVTIVFSHLEKCPFLHQLGLTINYEFIKALLVYDKIANGETGFHQISELPGGSRLERTPHAVSTYLIWDPRLIASQRLEPTLPTAATMLREVTQAVIAARADSLNAVTVNLSGGLDSSIVLACLAESHFSGRVNAVHHVVDSGDPSELSYARAAADAAGCPLMEMHFKPGPGLPDIYSHPLSVRPWRQFLSTTPLNGYDIPQAGERVSVFTGQGGDHLFHVAETDAGFTDYLSCHGPGPRTLTELLNAARLSGRSVWSVTGRGLRTLITHRHESEMVRTLRHNRNPLNDALHARLTPETCLPSWAVHRTGIPPGKFDQVSALLHLFMIRETLDRPVLRDIVHPLMSQPLIELCLRLPIYMLCQGGVSRGLAREAFRGRIPDIIRTRLTKGETSRYVIAGIQKDLPVISDALRHGSLVAQELIPRDDLERALAQDQIQTGKLVRRLRMAYAIEAWLRSWQKALRGHYDSA